MEFEYESWMWRLESLVQAVRYVFERLGMEAVVNVEDKHLRAEGRSTTLSAIIEAEELEIKPPYMRRSIPVLKIRICLDGAESSVEKFLETYRLTTLRAGG